VRQSQADVARELDIKSNVISNLWKQFKNYPAKFPDLSPMDHAWDVLVRAVVTRQSPPRIIPELIPALEEDFHHESDS